MTDESPRDAPGGSPISPPMAPLKDEPTPYPWGLCIGRFLKRLCLGSIIWIIVFVLLLLSALPSGGGGSKDLLVFVKLTTLLVSIWALGGFLPPSSNWEQTITASQMAGYVFLAMLGVALAVAALS